MNLFCPKYTYITLTTPTHNPPLPWLQDEQDFPSTGMAWGEDSVAPGLLCAGDALDLPRLHAAYTRGIFPWFSADQPVLWWSPDPRMVLQVDEFRVSPSLKKTLRKFSESSACEVKFDTAFKRVIQACANAERVGQRGTWIMPEMVDAYQGLHELGLAHSVETWVSGRLVGGLYCVALGRAVFGESMFHLATDASKIALAALIGFCRHEQMPQIDCQQNTRHLKSLGAREVPRKVFESRIADLVKQPSPDWEFSPIYWDHILANP
jgi:leucyl/phenylalanyl-tRNA--protein transferase